MLPGSCCTSNVKLSGGLRKGPAHNELVRRPAPGGALQPEQRHQEHPHITFHEDAGQALGSGGHGSGPISRSPAPREISSRDAVASW